MGRIKVRIKYRTGGSNFMTQLAKFIFYRKKKNVQSK